MIKLLKLLNPDPDGDTSLPLQTRYTRFETSATGEPQLSMATKKFTRFAPKQTPASQLLRQGSVPQFQPANLPPANRDTAQDVPPGAPVSINETAHLHSDAQIPLSVLFRALPQRFANMQD